MQAALCIARNGNGHGQRLRDVREISSIPVTCEMNKDKYHDQSAKLIMLRCMASDNIVLG